MGKESLSEREAALIASARRELATGPLPRPTPAPPQAAVPIAAPAPTPVPPAMAKPDSAARIAALLSAEQEANQRRRKKLRQLGLAIPAIAAIAAALWLASALLRYLRF